MFETLRGRATSAVSAARRWLLPAATDRRTVALRWGSVAAVLIVLVGVPVWLANRPADIVVGAPPSSTTEPTDGPRIVLPPTTGAPAPATGGGGGGAEIGGIVPSDPDGAPYPPAIPFHSTVGVPDHLLFVLAIGSDARPGESVTRTRADSIHLLALNPQAGTGTVLGIPRDTWVEIPGRGQGKINSALALGGPDLLAATVRNATGLPVDYWVVTGFQGFQAMVDTLGGVTVHVERTMADSASGAYFKQGWHHLDGFEALAFSRNRKNVPNGDFSRSANHGKVLLGALHKVRAEVGDQPGLGRWLNVLVQHAQLEIGRSDLEVLAAAARRTDPGRVTNVVAPGRVGKARGQSVVFLTASAAALFDDIRPDATVGAAPPPTTAPPPPPTTTTTTAPPPTPTTTVAPTTSTTGLLP